MGEKLYRNVLKTAVFGTEIIEALKLAVLEMAVSSLAAVQYGMLGLIVVAVGFIPFVTTQSVMFPLETGIKSSARINAMFLAVLF